MSLNETTLNKCEKLLSDICTAQSCLTCAKKLAKKTVDEEIKYHKEFFNISRLSFLYTGTILLCKCFENDCNVTNIYKIINIFLTTNICTIEEKLIFKNLNKELFELSEITNKLKLQRNRFYAHNDKIDSEKLLEIATVNYSEKEKLITFAKRVLSHSICIIKKEPHSSVVYNDIPAIRLDNVLGDIESYYAILKDYQRILKEKTNE